MKAVVVVLIMVGILFSVSHVSAEETMYIVEYPDTFLRRMNLFQLCV